MNTFFKVLLGALCGFPLAFSATITPKTNALHSKDKEKEFGLDQAMKELNSTGGTLEFPFIDGAFNIYLVDRNESNTLTQVRAVNSNPSFEYQDHTITIDGKGGTLFGDRAPHGGKIKGNTVRGFFVGGNNSSGSTSLVTIQNLIFTGCGAVGGTGGGGGMGAGAGLYVGEGTKVLLDNCAFQSCTAKGGTAGNKNSIGGGGMKGYGGTGGGGGFGGNADDGGGGGASSFKNGNAEAFRPGGNFDGNRDPSGGPGIGGKVFESKDSETNGGFGGGGGLNSLGSAGGDGQGGYGGGGAYITSLPLPPSVINPATVTFQGSDGGFGGGGGNGQERQGGNGGFGGGGGIGKTGGTGGFGAGNASSSIAGNGAGFGGAIFMEPNAELTICGSISFQNNLALPASGTGNPGIALGNDIFMMSSSQLIFDLDKQTCIMFTSIEGNQGDVSPQPFVPNSTKTGGITKKGTAKLMFTGANTYTGITSVETGTLEVNGSLVSNVEVASGAMLQGLMDLQFDATATNGGELSNSGTFFPSYGTKIAKTYTNETGGVFQVDITPIGVLCPPLVTGDAIIKGGDLVVNVGQGNYVAGTEYLLISGNVSGKFDNQDNPTLTGPGAQFVDFKITSGSLILTLFSEHLFVQFPDPLIPGGVVTPIILSSKNGNLVINCLINSSHPPGSDLALVLQNLGMLSVSELNEVCPALCARQYGSLEWINARNNSYVADLLTQHLSRLCRDCECSYSGWVTGFGNIMSSQKSLNDLQPYNADAAGLLAGVDFALTSCFTWGGAFGYTRTAVLWRRGGGGGHTDSYYGALYGDYESDCFGVDFSVLGGATSNQLHRHIAFANIDRDARSDFWSYFATGHLGLVPFRWTGYADCTLFHFEPFALVDYHYYTHETFSEKGATSLNLRVNSKNQHMLRGEAGIKWIHERCCDRYTLSPYIGVSWVGEFPLYKSRQPATFIKESCTMDCLSYDSSEHFGSPQVGIQWSHCNGASFLLGYKGLYNDSVRINEIEGRIEWIF